MKKVCPNCGSTDLEKSEIAFLCNRCNTNGKISELMEYEDFVEKQTSSDSVAVEPFNENIDDMRDIDALIDSGKPLVYTPKGALGAAVAQVFELNPLDARVDSIWILFEEYARRKYGSGNDIAVVVFNKESGTFASIPSEGLRYEEEE